MANPLACAVANASLALILENKWQQQVKGIEQQLLTGLMALKQYPNFSDVRVLGAIGVIETSKPVDVPQTQNFFLDRGVWVRPFGKLIYIMPPYIIEANDLATIITAIQDYAAQSTD